MRAMLVIVLLEFDELPLEISRGSEQHPIQTFAPYDPNQPFDDRMGARYVRHRLDFSDVEDPQVRAKANRQQERGSRTQRERVELPNSNSTCAYHGGQTVPI
jgi:hypothetical protein